MKRLAIPVLFQIALVHFVSHVHIMTIPALLPLLPEFMGVTFVKIGAAVSVFNIVSAFVQAPLGFATDRFGPRNVLCAGLAVGSVALLAFAFVPTYAWLLVMAALTGLANGVYHPGDYALLSRSVPEARMGRAFSIHSFAGFLGAAVTPASLIAIAAFAGIQAAFAASALLGLASLAVFVLSEPSARERQTDAEKEEDAAKNAEKAKAPGVPVSVFTVNVAVLTFLFILLNLNGTALERFSVSALMQGYGIPLSYANAALTAFLFCSAFGVLGGGSLADKTRKHGLVAAIATAIAAVLVIAVILWPPSPLLLVPVWAVIGLLTGVIVPSRDMLVRAASPPGAEGKTFGIVSTGFNIGGAIGPVAFGYFLDHALPKGIFISSAVCLIGIVAVTLMQDLKKPRHSSGS